MPGKILHVFERHILIEQIGDDGYTEAMRREEPRQAGICETPLHHLTDRVRRVAGGRESFRLIGLNLAKTEISAK
jgi:hypothetical protein